MTSSDDDLARQLLHNAGLDASGVVVAPLPSEGLINSHFLVRLNDGTRFVMRKYGWPWGATETFDRQAKEAWLLPRLAAAGVPAPRFVAAARDGQVAAILVEYIDGAPLGALDDRTPAMWRAAGAALRAVHDADIGLPTARPGMIVAGGVDPFAEGWGGWHIRTTREHAERLVVARPDLDVDVARCIALMETACTAMDARPLTLIHTDANPWNVLIDAAAVATWVDWEFAWIGDRLYDFVRMTLARKRDLGPLPAAFFEGYGSDPTDDPVFAVYALGFHMWMVDEATAPLLPLQVTYDTAERYLRELPAHLGELERAFT